MRWIAASVVKNDDLKEWKGIGKEFEYIKKKRELDEDAMIIGVRSISYITFLLHQSLSRKVSLTTT